MNAMRKLSVAVLLCAVATGTAYADEIVYKANLQPSSEVPPTTSKGSGDVTAMLDTSSKVLKWAVSYRGLTGQATMAHFHGPAPVGQNAGVQIPVDIPKTPNGSVKGEATLTDAQITELQTGKWYFNVHTEQNKSGEIRGQLMPTSAPTQGLGAVKTQ
jgi:CHRD domain